MTAALPNHIRFAKPSDCYQILEIYSYYILESAVTFETKIPSLEDFINRFKKITEKYPWIVFEKDDQVLGYAYASPHRSRSAYDWACEVTVYVHKNHHKKGIGPALYKSLFPILKEQGFYNLFAGITHPNEGSIKAHSRLGFQKIGTYKNIGYKNKKWRDTSWYQLEINSNGEPFKPFSVQELFEKKLTISTVDPKSSPIRNLIKDLDNYLEKIYPSEENFLDSPEDLSKNENYMVGAYTGDLLVGTGAVKFFDDYAEIKRMWVPQLYRGFGVSKKILLNLEEKARKLGLKHIRLETGNLQKEALGLYNKFNYKSIPPFGDYQKNDSSHFMGKLL